MKKSKKPKKIRSIKHQITFTFIGLLFLSILTISMINGAFLEKYYVSKKTETLLEAREVLSQINTDSMTEDDVESEQEELSSEIIQESSRNNLTWVVVNEDNTKYLCWPENEDQLRSKLFFGYASDLDMDNGKGTILKQTDNCVVQQVHDRFVGMDYVECWGKFDNGNYFLIRSPLESIQESANISNKFYFFVGIVIIVISGMCIMAVTRKLTRPISELTELSRKMTDLDFEARYKSKAGNEIDVLGDNFNKMSSQLEHTISELKSANNELQKDIEDKVKIDEMRKEFLDNVSHELKTPIALVQGYAEGLKENINDDQTNCTRFIVVTNQKVFLKHAQKISICLELPHESGSLYRLLSHFIYNDLNMTRIESRPIEGKNWEYRFFIDFEGNMADPAVKNAIRGLREEGRNMRILGNY